ncbi:hypothetical protein Q8A73_006696 [Channa argus]|nr:hypothetical protein Q8A73_006696 [Channa argus]
MPRGQGYFDSPPSHNGQGENELPEGSWQKEHRAGQRGGEEPEIGRQKVAGGCLRGRCGSKWEGDDTRGKRRRRNEEEAMGSCVEHRGGQRQGGGEWREEKQQGRIKGKYSIRTKGKQPNQGHLKEKGKQKNRICPTVDNEEEEERKATLRSGDQSTYSFWSQSLQFPSTYCKTSGHDGKYLALTWSNS